MTILDISTFQIDPAHERDAAEIQYGWQCGTIDATLNGKTQTLKATHYGKSISAHGFVRKYRTGTKLWPASVTLNLGDKPWESIGGGFDSRSGKHHIGNGLWFRDDVKNPDNIAKR